MQGKLAVKEFFDDVAFKWDDICKHSTEKLKFITYLVNIEENSSVIDLACGTGIMTKFLLEYKPSYLLGVDFSENMIEIAKSKFKSKTLEYLAADIFDINQKFDVAVMYSAYPHFEDKGKLVRKIYDVLNNQGRFIIAHSESKECINNMHNNIAKANISTPLLPVHTESKQFLDFFNIDIMIDTSNMYILSGTKK